MTDVLCVFGTRPDAIKTVPVIEALRAAGVATVALATGQHKSLVDDALLMRLGRFVTLDVASDGSIMRFMARAHRALTAYLAAHRPRSVLVQGDTMSAMVGALCAREAGIPVAHVEAGVRSGSESDPWPEEIIRVAIDRMATWRYAPTEHAFHNLASERLESIVTGNTGIDALHYTDVHPCAEANDVLLVTLHRREMRTRSDAPAMLQGLCDAIGAAPIRAFWPVHPGMHPLLSTLRIPTNFVLCPPLAHTTMLQTLAEARGVLTDSGGLVEEAAALGVPTAILRVANDRPEAEHAGIARLFAPTAAGAQDAVTTLAAQLIPRKPTQIFGGGRAAERVATHLARELARLA
jgi:UDP-N-acetylglucosamine 2-epimerase (non-hydrolysing)